MAGTIRYRNGAWRLQVYAGIDAAGKRKFVTKTVHEPDTPAGEKRARKVLAALVTDVDRQSVRPGETLTVAELLERWFAQRQASWSPANRKQYRHVIDVRLVPYLGRVQVGKLRAIEIDALYAKLAASGGRGGAPLAPSTVRKAHIVLHAALEQAVTWDLIAVNPASKTNKIELPRVVPSAPEAAEVSLALELIEGDPLFHLYVRLAATTGARRGSLLALRWSDVDLEVDAIRFARSISDGGKDFGGLVERPGSKSGLTYTVSIDGGTVALLNAARLDYLRRSMAAGDRDGDWFIFDLGTGLPWHPDHVSKKWRQLRAEAGLDHVKLKSLRHYVATRMLADGDDVRTVADRLGHANPSITLNIYSAHVPKKDQAAAARLGALLDEPRDGTG